MAKGSHRGQFLLGKSVISKIQLSFKSKRIFAAYEAGEYTEMGKLLSGIPSGAQFVAQTRRDEMTLLHHVAFAGNLEALHEIAKLPYFAEVVDENANEVRIQYVPMIQQGWTPLLWAATKKHMAVVRVLVEEGGASVLKAKGDGMTPLHVGAS